MARGGPANRGQSSRPAGLPPCRSNISISALTRSQRRVLEVSTSPKERGVKRPTPSCMVQLSHVLDGVPRAVIYTQHAGHQSGTNDSSTLPWHRRAGALASLGRCPAALPASVQETRPAQGSLTVRVLLGCVASASFTPELLHAPPPLLILHHPSPLSSSSLSLLYSRSSTTHSHPLPYPPLPLSLSLQEAACVGAEGPKQASGPPASSISFAELAHTLQRLSLYSRPWGTPLPLQEEC